MSGDTRPSNDGLVTPMHVWAGLSADQRTQVIAALAHLAVQLSANKLWVKFRLGPA